jgi:hypothetical protein
LEKQPIPVVMTEGEPPLSSASRVCFAVHHPIQYNVKIRDIGYVYPDYMAHLLGYWNTYNRENDMDISMSYTSTALATPLLATPLDPCKPTISCNVRY